MCVCVCLYFSLFSLFRFFLLLLQPSPFLFTFKLLFLCKELCLLLLKDSFSWVVCCPEVQLLPSLSLYFFYLFLLLPTSFSFLLLPLCSREKTNERRERCTQLHLQSETFSWVNWINFHFTSSLLHFALSFFLLLTR